VPNEEPKGPGISVFPQSITTHEGSKITFTLETIREANSSKSSITDSLYTDSVFRFCIQILCSDSVFRFCIKILY
jgi:hypothetical protein